MDRRIFLMSSAATAVAASGLAKAAITQRDPLVRVAQGPLMGARDDRAMAWKGIPYAEPPVGKLRFRAPQPAKPWNGTRDAAQFGNMAVQDAPFGRPAGNLLGSEDCLTLNVWAPLDGRRNLPVIVWIHGGGFIVGSSSEPAFAGDRYASECGVVFVSCNYRLNGFGFFHHPADPGSVNAGLLDQVAALRWVRENIAAFGGDPANVTVMGESAGAMSIGHLLGLPASEGAFDRAIIQSGGTSHLFSNGEQVEVSAMILRDLGIAAGDHGALEKLDTMTLRNTFINVNRATRGSALTAMQCFHPAVDGVHLKRHPLHQIRPVPTLIGHCKYEMASFAGSLQATGEREPLAPKSRALAGDDKWDAMETLYKKESRSGASWAIELYSDVFCNAASHKLAEQLTKAGAPAWSYRFDYPGASPFGAGHATDLAFTFYRGDDVAGWNAWGRPMSWTPEARSVGFLCRGLMAAFATTGKPVFDGLPAWQTYDGSWPFMSIDAKPALMTDFLGADRRKAWDEIKPEQMI